MGTPITALSGIGARRAALLQKLGLLEVEDFLTFYPRRYEDRSLVLPIDEVNMHRGEAVSIVATVLEPAEQRRLYGGKTITRVRVGDHSGVMTLTYFNNPYIKEKLKTGKTFNFYGRLDPKSLLNMIAPQTEEIKEGEKPRIYPIYPMVAGLSQGQMRKWVKEAFLRGTCKEQDPLPQKLIEKYQLMPLADARRAVHFPKTMQEVQMGRRRLIFEELLYFQLGLSLYSRRQKEKNQYKIPLADGAFAALHPFTPTESQKRAVGEIQADLSSAFAMNRLLQGDVGSGKTYVAGEAIYATLRAGWQAAIMAPTEILARQHFEYFAPLFEKLGYKGALLVGAMTQKEKKEVYQALAEGSVQFAVGTHALLQEQVQFKELALVVADEQHRFGVRQRATLAHKGKNPHVLVMSATPIPRTMALMVWGDLDLSVLDGRPAGRKEVQTFLVNSSFSERLQGFLEKQIAAGGQVYMVCPLVEEAEESELLSAEAQFEALREQYGNQVDLIHGKMKPALKDRAMARFAAGETKILVSTTVIEVGINVPQATLMILQNAERFGLSQLHQLRGRVGRGPMQSYCILVSDHEGQATKERLSYFCSTTDGFAISEKDLQLRGPGDFFGSMQHGLPKMQIADCAPDISLLELSNACAKRILEFDPALEKEYNRLIFQKVERLFQKDDTVFN